MRLEDDRSPPHPLVKLLTNRPDAWHLLIDQVGGILANKDARIQSVAMEMVRPFVAFLLLEPQQSAQYTRAREGLRRTLVDACHRTSDVASRRTVGCLLKVFTRFQFDDCDKILTNSHFLESILNIVRSRVSTSGEGGQADDINKEESRLFWSRAASECAVLAIQTLTLCLPEGVPASGLAQSLTALCQEEQFSISPPSVDHCLLVLSQLLSLPSAFHSPVWLRLATSLVSRCSSSATRICLASVIAPALRCVTSPAGSHEIWTCGREVQQAAQGFLQLVDSLIAKATDEPAANKTPPLPLPTSLSPRDGNASPLMTVVLSELLKKESSDDAGTRRDSLEAWLTNLSVSLTGPRASLGVLSNVVSAILLTVPRPRVTKATLAVLVKIAQLVPSMAPDMLPVLLHALGRITSPECRLIILEGMPSLATHKYCVAPILKTIQALASSGPLQAVSLRMLMLLWKQQDRVFPHLLRAVNQPSQQTTTATLPPQAVIDEDLLAKAKVIHEICKLRPEQHGAELLQPLSAILNSTPSPSNTTACAVALEGLFLLCRAEVIDLKSLWSVLGKKLIDETRSIVVCKICKLLSLVPELAVETAEYQAFTEETIGYLWLYTLSPDLHVRTAAFEALSNFSADLFKVSHLPGQLTESLRHQADLANQQTQAEGTITTVDEMFPNVPGSLYVSQLQSVKEEAVLSGYTKLLKAMTGQEISGLPRGIFYSSLRRQGLAGSQSKALQGVPTVVQQLYTKCQEPGLRPGLSAGVLFCYDPAVEVGRDGRARKHYVIRHGKTFLQMFSTLLQDVPVQPSDWHLFTLLPQAWNSFMERLFVALLEGRKAELELQEKHGHADMDEVKEKKSLAWLWVREAILDAIKSASRGNAASQSNSILSLASLCLCVQRFVSDLDPEVTQASDASSEYMGHSHWLTVSCDTILSFIDTEFKPKGGIHGLCHQTTGGRKTAASSICQGMARIAASQLVPVYTALDAQRAIHLLDVFQASLAAKGKLTSPVQVICNDLASGMLLGRLFEEHFSEMTGSKGMLAVWKTLSALESLCLSPDMEENRQGAMLGLGIALCGLCNDGKTESRAHVKATIGKLLTFRTQMAPEEPLHQSLSIAMASVCGSMYACNMAEEEVVSTVLKTLQEAHQSHPQSTGVCLALGLLTFSLGKQGYQSVSPVRQRLATNWTQDVQKEDTPPLERVAKLNGLLSLIGSEQSLIRVHGSSKMTETDIDSSKVITLVTSILINDSDLGLQNVSAWMLGHLLLSACTGSETRTNVPTSYSYLPETSILRALIDFLLEAGKSGPELISESHVVSALQCLKTRKTLPPLNWAGVLSSLMRISFGTQVKSLCLQTASNQMASSPTAAMFLSSWIVPPLFLSLPLDTQACVHRQMPDAVKTISPSALKVYFERSCVPAFTGQTDGQLHLAVLLGLRDSLALEDPPASVTFLLYEATLQVYYALPNEFNMPCLKAMAECLALVPDDVLDSIIGADFADSSTQIKGCFIRCHLVATQRQPLALLNYMVDASFNTDYWQCGTGFWLLCHSLAHLSKSKDESTSAGGQVADRQKWFLELLGHTSSIIKRAIPLAETAPPMREVIGRIVSLMACAVMTITFPGFEGVELLGLSPDLFKDVCQGQTEADDCVEAPGHSMPTHLQSLSDLFTKLGSLLPTASHALCQKPWNSLISKVLDWIQTTLLVPDISSDNKETLINALMTLRDSPDFKPAIVWTRAVLLAV